MVVQCHSYYSLSFSFSILHRPAPLSSICACGLAVVSQYFASLLGASRAQAIDARSTLMIELQSKEAQIVEIEERYRVIKSGTGLSKASDTKRNVIASPSDEAVMHAMHHLVAICLQFQLYPLLFVHLIIVLGFSAVAPLGEMAYNTTL